VSRGEKEKLYRTCDQKLCQVTRIQRQSQVFSYKKNKNVGFILKERWPVKIAARFGGCGQRPMIILTRFFFGSFLFIAWKRNEQTLIHNDGAGRAGTVYNIVYIKLLSFW